MKDTGGEALTLTLIGLAYTSLGEPQKTLGFYNQALPLFRAGNNPIGQAVALQTIGGVYNSLGESQKALDFLNQARVINQKIGNRTGEAEILNTIGSVYDSLGEKQQSLDSYNQALSLFQAMGDRARVAFTLSNIGSVYNSLGENQKALDSYNQALSLQRAVQDRGAEATTLTYTALVYESLGDYPRSVDSYNQALSLFRAVGDRFSEAQTLDNIAGVYRLSGDLNQAIDSSNQALSLWRSQKNRFGEASTLTTLVRIYEALGNSQQALDATNQAVSLFQGMSDRAGVASAIAIKKDIDALLAQYQEVQTQIRATSPRYAALTQPQPLTLSEIQQQVLDDNTLLLEYSLGDQRSYVWAVTKTGITSYELPKRADIEVAVRKFRDALTVPRLRTSPTKISEAATNLSQIILAPVAQQLGQKRLVVVSDGALQYVPFAALPAPSRQGSEGNLQPLIVDHEIVNLPSASTLAIVRRDLVGRKPAPKTVAVLADPVFSQDDERLIDILPDLKVRGFFWSHLLEFLVQ